MRLDNFFIFRIFITIFNTKLKLLIFYSLCAKHKKFSTLQKAFKIKYLHLKLISKGGRIGSDEQSRCEEEVAVDGGTSGHEESGKWQFGGFHCQ